MPRDDYERRSMLRRLESFIVWKQALAYKSRAMRDEDRVRISKRVGRNVYAVRVRDTFKGEMLTL